MCFNKKCVYLQENITINSNFDGWNPNTDFGCDLKTLLRSNRRMQTGKDYQGVLRRDSDLEVDEFLCRDAHYTFIETVPQKPCKRNPRVFDGQYITITRRSDGSLWPNFKPLRKVTGFTVDGYAIGVCNELRKALKGLVEE